MVMRQNTNSISSKRGNVIGLYPIRELFIEGLKNFCEINSLGK